MSYMSFKCLHNLSAFADFAVFDFVCLEEGQELFSGPGIRIACAARWLSALKACEISCFESAKVIMFQISVSFRHSIKICRPDSPSSVFCHSQSVRMIAGLSGPSAVAIVPSCFTAFTRSCRSSCLGATDAKISTRTKSTKSTKMLNSAELI